MIIDNDFFKKLIGVFLSNADLKENELALKIESLGLDLYNSKYLCLVVPLIFSRMVLDKLNVNYTDNFEIHLSGGGIRKGKFSTDLKYGQLAKAAKEFVSKNFDSEAVMTMAQRSPEFMLINNYLQQGHSASEVILSDVVLII